ncbi:MAG TPA: type I polyketide synthase, partial [Polyangiaceae bacterium]|nr:type I polyketide synthase [Polyangiaceae bacterium]
QALANAGLSPSEVDAVDAHGTGTTLGDPIEAQALLATYGQGRSAEEPLALGSLKSNIGHTQAAAAVGSVIKMVMAMQHELLPKTLHAGTPSPHVDWSSGSIALLTETRPWKRTGRPRRCGVSAFGVSGTNGHVILEEAPAEPNETESEPPSSLATTRLEHAQRAPWQLRLLPCVLSGKTESALRERAAALAASWEKRPEWRLRDVASSLTSRANFKHRAVLFASDEGGALEALRALAEGSTPSSAFSGVAPQEAKLAFLFSGQGSQRPGMGHVLYAAFPEFASAFDEVCAEFENHSINSLASLVFAPEGSELAASLDQTQYTQVALFAFEVALYRLFAAWGVAPDYLIGHSIGELVAAHVSGVFSLADACKLVAARGRLMQGCRPGGAMIAIEATEAEIAESLVPYSEELDIAALNGPRSTVVSGHGAAAVVLAELWRGRGRKVKRLRVSHAFHSPHMNEMLPEFRRVAETIEYFAPTIPIVSNVTGKLSSGAQLMDPEYWVRHVRDAVRFVDGVRTLEAKGVTAFVELGPDAVLTALGQACVSDGSAETLTFLSTQRPGRPQVESLTNTLAELYVHGVGVRFREAFRGTDAAQVDLPTYAFEHRRYWLDCTPRSIEMSSNSGDADRQTSPEPASGLERYRVVWRPIPDAIHTLNGTWLVFAPETHERDFGLLAWLTSGLASRGARVRLVALSGEIDRARMREEVRTVLGHAGAPAGVLSLFALDDSAHPFYRGLSRGFAHSVLLAQALEEVESSAPLWCVTQGAVSTDDSDPVRYPAQSMAWGLGRVL